MKQVFFHNTANFTTSAATAANHVIGDLGIMTVANAAHNYNVPTPTAIATDFYIRQMISAANAANPQLRRSQLIKWGTVKDVKYLAYTAPVNQSTVITFAATIATSAKAIRITDVSAGQIPYPKQNIEFPVGKTTQNCVDIVIEALRRGTLKDSVVVTASTSTTVTLSGANNDVVFVVEEISDVEGQISVATTARTIGAGSPLVAKKLEEEMFASQGTVNFSWLPVLPNYTYNPSLTYDTVILTVKGDADSNINKGSLTNEIYLLFRAGLLTTAYTSGVEAKLRTMFGV